MYIDRHYRSEFDIEKSIGETKIMSFHSSNHYITSAMTNVLDVCNIYIYIYIYIISVCRLYFPSTSCSPYFVVNPLDLINLFSYDITGKKAVISVNY